MNTEEISLMESSPEKKKMSVWMVTFLIIGAVMGPGSLILPHVIQISGIYGFVLIFVIGSMCCYCGIKICNCWQIVVQMRQEYDTQIRNPYIIMADVSYGTCMREFIRVCIHFTLCGNVIVFMLFEAQIANNLLHSMTFNRCVLLVLCSALLVLPSYFRTIKDFWAIGIVSSLTVIVPVMLIIWTIVFRPDLIVKTGKYEGSVTWQGVSSAYGIVIFLYGSASTFPTIQMDMERKDKFGIALIIATGVISLTFFALAIVCYTFGNETHWPTNIIVVLKPSPQTDIIKGLFVIHLLTDILIYVNVENQEIEELLKIPKEFSWKRLISRTIVMAVLTFIAVSFSQFASIMNILGASSLVMLIFVSPLLFYMKLLTNADAEGIELEWKLPVAEKYFMWAIIVLTIVGGVISTLNAIVSLFDILKFDVPCYME